MARGRYGSAWERYPVEPGDVWRAGPHALLCADAFAMPEIAPVDVVYCDPPWDPGNLALFRGLSPIRPATLDWPAFMAAFAARLPAWCPDGLLFVEMGVAWHGRFIATLEAGGLATVSLSTPSYGSPRRPNKLWCGTASSRTARACATMPALDALSGRALVQAALHIASAMVGRDHPRLLDPCCGEGMTLCAADDLGMAATGCEIIPRKMAVAVSRLAHRHKGASRG